jgi:hypothetical protein
MKVNKILTSRERMLAALQREEADHVPFSPYISQGPWLKEPLLWRNQFERAEKMLGMGFDPTIDIWIPLPTPHPEVKVKTWREKKDGQILLTKEFHTPAGVLKQVVEETDDWSKARHGLWQPTTFGNELRDEFGMHLFDDYNVSRRLEPWVKGPEDLEKLKYLMLLPEGHKLDEWRIDTERAMEFAREHNLMTVSRRVIVGDAHQWFCDIEWFLIQLYESPDFVKNFFKIFQDWGTEINNLVLEAGVDVVQYRGWYEIPTFWGLEFWKEYIKPVIDGYVDQTHQADKLFSYLLPEGQGAYADLLKETNIDVCQGIDPLMLHGGDLNSLFTKLGDKKAFWGGINAEFTLESESYEKIEKEVEEAVETLGSNNGLILSSLIFQEVPLQGTLNLIKAWKKVCNVK